MSRFEADRDGHVPRAEGRARRRTRTLPRGRGDRRRHRARRRRRRPSGAPSRALLESVPRRAAADSKYTAGSVLVVGGVAGHDRRRVPERDGRAARGCRLRHARGPARVPACRRGARARARQDRVGAGNRARDDSRARPSVRRRLRSDPASDEATRRARSCASLLEAIDLPVVVDADALDGLEPVERAAPTVLTPHAGELGRLLGRDVRMGERPPASGGRERCADRFGAICPPEGCGHDRRRERTAAPLVCDLGPPSLATAGTGDVLTGVVAAFLAKGCEPRVAAAAAAVAHGLAARNVRQQAGLDRVGRGRRAALRSLLTWPARSSRSTSVRSGTTPGCSPTSVARDRALGRRQGRRLRPRRRRRRAGGAVGWRDRALRRDGGRGPRARAPLSPTRGSSSSARPRTGTSRHARAPSLELTVGDDRRAGGRPGAPQARHRNGPLGARRAALARPLRRRPDDASGHVRLRPGLRPPAARSLPRGDGALR